MLPLRYPHHSLCVFVVALNFQTHCSEMDVNQGRFLVNGKSGYVLKPAFMRDPRTDFDPITLTRGDWLQHKTLHVMVEFYRSYPKGQLICSSLPAVIIVPKDYITCCYNLPTGDIWTAAPQSEQ